MHIREFKVAGLLVAGVAVLGVVVGCSTSASGDTAPVQYQSKTYNVNWDTVNDPYYNSSFSIGTLCYKHQELTIVDGGPHYGISAVPEGGC